MPTPARGAWGRGRSRRNHGRLVDGPGSGLGHDDTAGRGDRGRGRFGLRSLGLRFGGSRRCERHSLFGNRRGRRCVSGGAGASIAGAGAAGSGAGGGATGAGAAASTGRRGSDWSRNRRRGHSGRGGRGNRSGRCGRMGLRRRGPGRRFNGARMSRMSRCRGLDDRNRLGRYNRHSRTRGGDSHGRGLGHDWRGRRLGGNRGRGRRRHDGRRLADRRHDLARLGTRRGRGRRRYRHHRRSRLGWRWLRWPARRQASAADGFAVRPARLPAFWPESPSAHRPVWKYARDQPSAVCPGVLAMTRWPTVQPAGWGRAQNECAPGRLRPPRGNWSGSSSR